MTLHEYMTTRPDGSDMKYAIGIASGYLWFGTKEQFFEQYKKISQDVKNALHDCVYEHYFTIKSLYGIYRLFENESNLTELNLIRLATRSRTISAETSVMSSALKAYLLYEPIEMREVKEAFEKSIDTPCTAVVITGCEVCDYWMYEEFVAANGVVSIAPGDSRTINALYEERFGKPNEAADEAEEGNNGET